MVKNRHTIHLDDEVFAKLSMYVTRWGNTKEGIVNQAIYDYVYARQNFLKMDAPHLNLEDSTLNAIFINDAELEEIAVVRIQRPKENAKSKGTAPRGITLSC